MCAYLAGGPISEGHSHMVLVVWLLVTGLTSDVDLQVEEPGGTGVYRYLELLQMLER